MNMILECVHIADVFDITFTYNGGCGWKKGTGFFRGGKCIELPEEILYSDCNNKNFDALYDGQLFVLSNSTEDLQKLLNVIDLDTVGEFLLKEQKENSYEN